MHTSHTHRPTQTQTLSQTHTHNPYFCLQLRYSEVIMYLCVCIECVPCMYLFMHACMHACVYACMYACMHVGMHACTYAHFAHTQTQTLSQTHTHNPYFCLQRCQCHCPMALLPLLPLSPYLLHPTALPLPLPLPFPPSRQ